MPTKDDCICEICKKAYKYKRHTNSHKKCQSCSANGKRHERKKKAVDYKGGKCELCGYNKCMSALAFHHKDPKEKDFEIGGKHCTKWETVQKELDKCILLCHNCHCETHEKS